jgi:hypothetical protein
LDLSVDAGVARLQSLGTLRKGGDD